MKRLAIVLNPGSGKNETSKSEITKLFDPAKFELTFFALKKGIAWLQKSISDVNPQAIIAVGGDGTVNAVATLAIALELPIGVIPVGTLNHFAKDMGLPLDPADAAVVIAKLKPTKIDYGSVNDHIFVNNGNLGIYPEVVIKRDKLTGLLNKWTAAAIAVIQAHIKPRRQKFELLVDGVAIKTRAGSLFIGNNQYQLKGREFTTRKKLDSGVLQLVIIKTGRIRHLIAIIISFILKHPHEKTAIYSAKNIQIRSSKKHYQVAVDGEVLQLETPLTITIHPKELGVLT